MSQGKTPTDLEARVRRLESANRRLLALCSAVVGLSLVAATRSPETPDHVRARSLEIVDETGRVQARLAPGDEGPELELFDLEGVARVALGHGEEGTALYLRDAEGTTRIGVAQFAHGGGGFALHGEASKGAAVLYLKAARGSLTFYGEDGSVVSRLPDAP